MADRVVTPEGDVWQVRRRWDPRRHDGPIFRRLRARTPERWKRGDLLDAGAEGAGCAADALEGVFVIAAIALLGVLVFYVIVPLLLIVIDLTVLVVVVGGAVLGRILFKRPWIVEATRCDRPMPVQRWEVVGWRASGDHVRHIREQLTNGMPLPEPLPSDPSDPGGPR